MPACSQRWLFPADATLTFAGLVSVAGLVLSYLWVAFLLPAYNSEHITSDGIHHAILVYCQGRLVSPERAVVASSLDTYPQFSHWLASWLLPLFGGDPFKALRCFALASVFTLLALQYHLLRKFLPTAPAFMTLLWWQLLCHETRSCNAYIYLDTFFFAQAIGGLFLWLMIALLSSEGSPTRRFLLTLLGGVCAALAYLCHIVPGVIALGGIGAFLLLRLIKVRNATNLLLLLFAVGVGVLVVFGTPQLSHMAGSKGADGEMPLRRYWLMVLWVPTLLAALSWGLRGWKKLEFTDTRTAVLTILVCILLGGGLLQGYAAYEWLVAGTAAAYSVKKFFYLLFPVCALLWFLCGSIYLPRWSWSSWLQPLFFLEEGPATRTWPRRALQWGVVTTLLYVNYSYLVIYQFRGPYAEPDRNPVLVAERLRRELPPFQPDNPAARSERFYYDPVYRRSSVYINAVGLRRTFAEFYNLHELMPAGRGNPSGVLEQMRQRQFRASELLMPTGVPAPGFAANP